METSKTVTERRIPEDVILSTGLYNRYWVLDVQEAVGPSGTLEKHLKITASKTTQPTETCILKDGWESMVVAVGDIVHLEGECVSGTWVIDRESGFLVLLPDILISSTSIASSIRCMRRGVLGERFKGGSKQMLNGTIVHDIFQKAGMSRDFALEKLHQLADEALMGSSYLKEMYSLKLTQEDMRQEVEEYLSPVSDFVLVNSESCNCSWLLHRPSEPQKQDAECSVAVTDFVDIEENIWSPRFGLKGKIDLTARVRIHRRGRPWQERVVPLELKTGRESNSIEHRSQVILYNLMSLERRSDAEAGFLLYLKTGNMHPIVSSHMDKRELLKLRNTLAHHLGNSLVQEDGKHPQLAPLPPIISDSMACKYCPQRRNCALYNRAVESRGQCGLEPPNKSQSPFLEEESQHLREAHLQYFSQWVLLCTLEAVSAESRGGRRSIWLQNTQEKETQGGCVGNLLRTGKVTVMSDNKYVHHFRRQGPELAGAGFNVGDKIVVSGQDVKLFAVAKGYVTEVSRHGVACSLDQNLSKLPGDVVFRLDQDEGEKQLYIHLGNLSKLMENSPESERLRRLVVEFDPPRFIPSLSSVLPQDAKDTVANILKGLNKPQKQAMKKVLLSKDYTLIVGMPGTGKTTTICSLVPAPELVTKGGISNPTEAFLVHCVAGCHASNIGIIAPYRQQLSSISSLLGDSAFSAVEVNTVDKYQGRDKSVVIVSFVRSHTEGYVGELLKDWRRLNVAVTRAKHKLIMLGCSPTLCHYAPLEKLLKHMEEEAMISFHCVPMTQEVICSSFHGVKNGGCKTNGKIYITSPYQCLQYYLNRCKWSSG
uniref:DNA replication ATP-dependent helicase/nuclease DNA2 n=1 Tax=Scleropages formosus TaxID=113540 RepID=A0A8C9WBK6_SCLFO